MPAKKASPETFESIVSRLSWHVTVFYVATVGKNQHKLFVYDIDDSLRDITNIIITEQTALFCKLPYVESLRVIQSPLTILTQKLEAAIKKISPKAEFEIKISQ